ncbi:MAG: tetratricopeptide repeat protein [Candidatus Omnitrophica bacterium]|nr:tetratricopeptide repeat protein [Candidatus Omnitrophota bacterium]
MNYFLKSKGKLYLQRIALILFGLFAVVAILEVSFRIGGYMYLQLQENKNIVSLEKKGAYRIMCLGASTTADFGGEISYPRQLESILNKKKLGMKFTVINKGMPAIQTTQIVERLKTNLDKYDPDIVVVMMGINDSFFYLNPPEENDVLEPAQRFFLSKFKIYKLYKILIAHIISKFKEKRIPAENDDAFDLLDKKIEQIRARDNLSNDTFTIDADENTLNLLAWSYLRKNRRDKAVVNSNDVWPDSGLGISLEKERKYQKAGRRLYVAARLFRLSIEKNPLNEWSYIGLGLCYEYQKKYKEAEKQYARALEIDPDNDKAYCRLGWVYKQKTNFKQAKAMFRKAVEINSRNANAYSGLGRCYRHESDYKKAKEMYQKSIKINPKEEWAYYGLAVCYELKDKDYDKARKMLEKALELNPGNGWACIRLGDIYKKIGEYEKIEEFYKRAIEINPKFNRLYGALAKFYKEQGLSSLASKYLDKIIRSTSIYYEPRVRKNYRKLKNILFERGVKLVCVQYPMRSVYPLKRVFESKKDIVFVYNEKIFKIEVAKHGYNKYFIDNFGGDFGHCTTAGNRLLAENIAKAIIDKYFKKSEKSRDTILN